MTRRWCYCGAPLYPYTPDHSGCRVCYLVNMTSQQVVWDEQERQGYTAEGEAIGSVMVWSVMGEPGFDPTPFNSTDDTAATSTWLPEGAATLPPIPEDAMPTGGDARRLDYALNRALTRLTPWGFRHRHRGLHMTIIEERHHE